MPKFLSESTSKPSMIPPPIFPFLPTKPINPIAGDDYFESLPDAIVTTILNMVQDAQSLCRCLAVCRRFASLIPEVNAVSVVVNPAIPNKPTFSLKSIFSKLLLRPPNTSAILSPALLSHRIKNFPHARHLRVRLPGNGGVPGGLLKWTAQFGKDLQGCAILGATTFTPSTQNPNRNPNQTRNHPSDEELRLRAGWILSSLVAACARHGVVKKALLDSPSLRSVVAVDDRQQGRLVMNEGQIEELRRESDDDPVWKPTNVPNVIVKLWYAKEFVLSRSGFVIKGGTVVAVRPDTGRLDDRGDVGTECELLRGGFGIEEGEDGLIGEVVTEIVKSKCTFMYQMRMKSFR